MQIIQNKLIEKELAPSSIILYTRNLQKLNDDLPFKNFKFLEDVEAIKNKLTAYKPNTQRGYYISIVSILNQFKDSKKLEKLLNQYYALMLNKNKEIKAIPQGVMSEQQKANWTTWDEVEVKINELKEKVDKFYNWETVGKQWGDLIKEMTK